MATQQNQQRFKCCYHTWVAQQKLDLDEMLQTLNHPNPAAGDTEDENQLRLLLKKSINHFQEYVDSRALLSQQDPPSFLSPSWGTTFSNSFLWIGGCRASLAIRLLYSLTGSELDAHITHELLQAAAAGDHEILSCSWKQGSLADLSANQLNLIDALHRATIKSEDHLSSRLATLQEDIVDPPLGKIAKECEEIGESSEGVDRAMDTAARSLANILTAADNLRLSTLKELMDILTPLQGVELLVVSKKLHLSIYEWGKRRDRWLGIPQNHEPSS